MDLSITGDGYIKCVADKSEHIDVEQITKINATNLSLPCMKDRYEENIMFYHIGDNISIAEYLKSTVLDFEKMKALALNLAEVFLELEQNGLSNRKVPANINYVFISPHTQQLKVIVSPIAEYAERDSYQRIMGSICRKVHSKNAYVVIGYIMEGINQADFNLENFKSLLTGIRNTVNRQERNVIQHKIVEKEIIKNTTSYILCGALAVVLEVMAVLVFPYIFKIMGIESGMYYNSLLLTVLLTIVVFGICKCVTGKEKTGNITQQPVKEMAEKTVVNENMTIRQPEPPKPKEPDIDKTGILEEEVEINPLKRQEMYNRNSVPTAYLIEEATNKQFEIRKNYFMIGRSDRCDLTVNSSIVSKEHAQIIYKSGDFYVKDLKSSNYTYLNKAQIEPEELYKIENGSRIGFGNQWYIFKTSL